MSIKGKSQYRNWLKSPQWEEVRQLCIAAGQGTCEGCGLVSIKNDAHHIHYPEEWSKTKINHLRILCRECHKKIHSITKPGSRTDFGDSQEDYKRAIGRIQKQNGLSIERRKAILHLSSQARCLLRINRTRIRHGGKAVPLQNQIDSGLPFSKWSCSRRFKGEQRGIIRTIRIVAKIVHWRTGGLVALDPVRTPLNLIYRPLRFQ